MKRLFLIFLSIAVFSALTLAQEAEKKSTPEAKTTPAAEKGKSEAAPATPAPAKMKGEISVKTIPAQLCATLYVRASDFAPKGGFTNDAQGFEKAYKEMVGEGFMNLGKWMSESKVNPSGPPFVFYFEDPSKVKSPGELTCKVCFPVPEGAKGAGEIKVETIPEKLAAVVQYEGAYDQANQIWMDLDKWIAEHGYVQAGAPSETYIKGMNETKNPAEFLTEIHQPVKKDEPKKEEKK